MSKKYISWNVNGLRACLDKGFMDFFDKVDADAVCLQEIKLSEGQLAWDKPGYHAYWNYAKKKGYSGTAVFSKEEPLSVSYDMGSNIPFEFTSGKCNKNIINVQIEFKPGRDELISAFHGVLII